MKNKINSPILILTLSLILLTFISVMDLTMAESEGDDDSDSSFYDTVDTVLAPAPTAVPSPIPIEMELNNFAYKSTNPTQFPFKVFFAEYNLLWAGVFQELNRYELQYTNKVIGRLKTRWIDNTEEEKFFELDEHENGDRQILASKFNLLVQLNPVVDSTPKATKMTVFKGQQVVHSNGDLAWENVASDGVAEENLFYRIEHFLKIYKSLRELKSKKVQTPVKTPVNEPVKATVKAP